MSEAVFDDDIQASWRRLQFAITHPSTAVQGVSSTAVRQMALAVEALEEVEDPVLHPGARRTLRYVAALIPLSVSESRVPSLVCEVANHPALPLAEVRAILRGDSPEGGDRGGIRNETPASKLRAVAQGLREGLSREVIADLEGVAENVVKDIAAFMGRAEAKEELLQDRALDWSGSASEFAKENGIGRRYASRLLATARSEW